MILVVAATEPELRSIAGASSHVEPLACGVGPVDAAIATARRLATGARPRAIVHVGIAGCRRGSGHSIGDVVIGAGARYCDSASALVATEALPDAALLRMVRAALPDAATATIGTSADVGGAAGCDVEAMEGFAVLRAAELAGVPAIEVRVVSNEVEEEDRALWDFAGALLRLEQLLPMLIDAIRSPVP